MIVALCGSVVWREAANAWEWHAGRCQGLLLVLGDSRLRKPDPDGMYWKGRRGLWHDAGRIEIAIRRRIERPQCALKTFFITLQGRRGRHRIRVLLRKLPTVGVGTY